MDSLLTREELSYLSELKDRGHAEQAELEKQALIKQRTDMKNLLSTEYGRSIIWAIMSRCDIFGTSMTGNSQIYFKEGRRSVGLEIMSEVIASDPNAWIDMQKHNLAEIQRTLTESD